ISDEDVKKAPFYKPADDSPEMKYLHDRRRALGGYLPSRPTEPPKIEVPKYDEYEKLISRDVGKDISTTMGFARLLERLCKDKLIGQNIVPIVPDESRTFGMEGMFRQVGIYAHTGQLYEPVDSNQLAYYKEAKDGQLLEEGITEAGSMSSFIAAGTAYSEHGVNMIPFFVYYSMFGFQRIGDLVWAACDMRAKGFMIGGTAGRTTLNGEGLQHQDGHSLLNAIAFPQVRAYDPAFHYETAIIIFDGLRRLYQEGETAIYYITVENENYVMPAMPEGAEEGIVKGMYKFSSREAPGSKLRVQLFGSGAILRSALDAQEMLAERYKVSSDVWSVTSYTQLRREAQECRRWNMLHPDQPPRQSYLEKTLAGVEGPFISASDYVQALGEQLTPWIPGDYYVLGTDGMGRSETREALRRHFEVDAESITIATLHRLHAQGKLDASVVAQAIKDLDYDPEKVNPLYA
ncbi:MAG: pyruvate dehydrogenase (acetyl-transferring), homodimeric type, partial [Planctomycetales bacterium]|nr:pyruvate dehydrogenase (acetyl-transferring), homodimeric type [Planctomycetales bacterium]